MKESNRKQDSHAEEMLGRFMDKAFYAKLHDKNGDSIQFERVKSEKSQREGIDVIIKTDKKPMYIDEKASFYYSNCMIPTFAFEINFMHKNVLEPVTGWFVNDDLKTECYMLIWPNIKCKKTGESFTAPRAKGMVWDLSE